MTRRVVVDATPYGPEPSGARRRLENLLPRLAERLPGATFDVLWARDGAPPPPEGPPPDGAATVRHEVVPVSCRDGVRRWRAMRRILEARARTAPFEACLVDHGPVFARPGVRTIVTVHDLRFLHGYGGLARRLYGRWRSGSVLRRAAAVVAVSDAIRDELRAAYRLDDVVVARNAAGPAFHPRSPVEVAATLARLGVVAPYVLAVGRDEPRKALGAAVAAARDARPSLPLVVVGEASFRDPGVRCVGVRSDDEVAVLLAGARWVLVPAHYEGFSLPVAESLAVGTPVLATDIAAHRALVDDGARGATLLPLPVRGRDGAWSWPAAAAALSAPPPSRIALPRSAWDDAAQTVAGLLGG